MPRLSELTRADQVLVRDLALAKRVQVLAVHGTSVECPEQLAPAFTRVLTVGASFVLDVHCGKDCPTPVSPWNQAKRGWMDIA